MNYLRTNRISYISAARVIGILLVVWGHSYPFGVPIPKLLEQVRGFVYEFHMPLFVLISGYLAGKSKKTAGDFISGRAKKLLIPYFGLSLLAFLPKMLVQQYINDSVDFSLAYLLRSELVPRDNVWGHFWFIPVIFFLGVFSVAIRGLIKKTEGKVLLLAGAYLLLWMPEATDWFAMEDMRINLIWYVLGLCLADTPTFENVVSKKQLLLALPAALLLFVFSVESKVLFALLMIGAVFHIGTVINVNQNRALLTVEKYSFTIFLLSWPAQAVVEIIMNRICHFPVWITMLGMFFAGMMIPLVCIKIVNWLEKYIPVHWLKAVLGM